MPKKFIEAERKIEKAIKQGKIPRFYYKNGIRHESNPYALARTVTGYHGTTHNIGMIHPKHKELIIKGKPIYINHLFNHLRKEHPSTRKRMFMK